MKLKRNIYCGKISENDEGKTVIISGWVSSWRDHGKIIFIDLRDREGIVQVVFEDNLYSLAAHLRNEDVISIKGKVRKRPPGTQNLKISTGKIEIKVEEIEILNQAENLPFNVEDDLNVSEELRLKYRYLDLRRARTLSNLKIRHQITHYIRNFLNNLGFIEVETPILTKSTPEGARDYLVPSRINPGQFYALPQSPQLFKQILMVGGLDKYFQISRCFRDEDLRRDRQPEFTQVDLEMSFVDREDVMKLVEDLIINLFKDILKINLKTPFPIISYQESLEKYGTDTPDLRFGMELVKLNDVFVQTKFKVFGECLKKEQVIKGINVPNGSSFSNTQLDKLTSESVEKGAQGLVWFRNEDNQLKSPVDKYFAPQELEQLKNKIGCRKGDLILIIADKEKTANQILGELREQIAQKLNLIKEEFNFCWIIDFPLFEYSEEEKRWVSCHHPFTSPRDDQVALLDTTPYSVCSSGYDLVLNGEEIGGGSLRIYQESLQKKIFELLNLNSTEIEEKFGFLLEAFKYGAPPHGGFAFGFDRLLMIITGENSIREVIAFPKTQRAWCPLTGAPAQVSPSQLKELHIKIEDGD